MPMQQTPLYHHHEQLGGRLVNFSGWALPVQYRGTLSEHMAVREHAGIFDVSHMGEFEFRGPEALPFLQQITANNVAKLVDGQAQYSLILNERGCIVDDIIVYRYSAEHFLMVVNAGNLDNDWHWVLAHKTGALDVSNISKQTALMALQGPRAELILQPLTPAPLPTIKKFYFAKNTIAGMPVTIARTGYTGSAGFEIFCANGDAGAIWSQILDAGRSKGLEPCGLGARDTLRLEMAYPLHGHDITDKTTPLETNLMWVVKLDKGDFIGRDALLAQQQSGLSRRLVGLLMTDPGIPRTGYPLIAGHKPIGYVTSGTISPMLKKGIALGFVPLDFTAPGTKLSVDIRGSERVAEVVATPFIGAAVTASSS